MEIETAKNLNRQIEYSSDSFVDLLSEIEDKTSIEGIYLILLVGKQKKQKKEALNKIKQKTERNFIEVDANDLFLVNETKTAQQVDNLFDNYISDESVIHITNGANLCGAFTGYTLSKVKYATPQERYFLKEAQKNNAFIIIEFEIMDSVDNTLSRASHSIVTFTPHDSGIKGFIAKLKDIHLNGYNLNSERPVNPEIFGDNF